MVNDKYKEFISIINKFNQIYMILKFKPHNYFKKKALFYLEKIIYYKYLYYF